MSNIIERCFGTLKGRFRCLLHSRELYYTPEKAALITNVCAMLHNICIQFNVNFDNRLLVVEVENVEATSTQSAGNLKNVANQIRNSIRDAL